VAGITFNILGFLVVDIGLVADMLSRIRVNQEKLLYYARKRRIRK